MPPAAAAVILQAEVGRIWGFSGSAGTTEYYCEGCRALLRSFACLYARETPHASRLTVATIPQSNGAHPEERGQDGGASGRPEFARHHGRDAGGPVGACV
eukprot:1195739-Prorocentrum_minimum.AAC.12